MPIPSPRKDETKDGFITRCMSSEVMKKEFPKNDQRFAVCTSKWDGKGESSLTPEQRPLLEEFLRRHPELLIEEKDGN